MTVDDLKFNPIEVGPSEPMLIRARRIVDAGCLRFIYEIQASNGDWVRWQP